MAISLKNIEDRVKTLENTILNHGKIDTLWSGYSRGDITLNKSLWDYNFVLTTGDYNKPYLRITTIREVNDIRSENIKNGSTYGCYLLHHAGVVSAAYQIDTSGKVLTLKAIDSTTLISVIGLKLYYNFSYNIIYKILSSIKFKISQIISSLKSKKEVKIMAISLKNHEDRITLLERIQSTATKILKLDEPKVNIKQYPKTYDVTNYAEYNAVAIAFDAWGNAFSYLNVQDTRIIPMSLLEERDVRVSMMWKADIEGTEGLLLRKIENIITVKYSGIEPQGSGFWWIYLLKIYYIFRYNIYNKIIRSIISKISHFFTKIFKYGGEIRDGYIC